LVACIALSAQAAPAYAVEKFTLLKAFGPDGTSLSGFTTAGPVAVDQQADVVYVLDPQAGSLLKFDLEGNPVDFGGSAGYISGNEITGLSPSGAPGLRQVAVDSVSHIIYVTGEAGHALEAFQADGEPALFTAGSGAGTNKIEGFEILAGVAVAANGDIYAGDLWTRELSIYAPSGLPITSVTGGVQNVANLAVDTNGTLYVNKYQGEVVKFTPSVFPVTATTTYTAGLKPVDPSQSYTVSVNPATSEVYIAEFGPTVRIALFDEEGTLVKTFAGPGEEGELDLSEGVAIDSQSEKVFVSNTPESGLSQVEVFQREWTPEKPSIESIAVTDVTADSATFHAQINPNTLASSYRFEYGLGDCAVSACTSVPAAGGAEIGSGHDPVGVSQSVTGLQPSTEYHYRVVAKNSLGVSQGADRTFTTQGAGLGFQLTDSRAWEMVSPPNKFGGEIRNSTVAPVQASVSGDALAYVSRGSIVKEPDGNRVPEPSSVLAKRQDGEWYSEDLTPPHTKASQIQTDGEYNLFSPDLSLAQLEPRDETPLSPAASEQTPYLRTSTEPPVFTPLVTSKEPYANVPPGTHFGRGTEVNPLRMEGASPDLTHVVLRSQLTPLITGAAQASLYMWVDGDLEAISEMPEGEGGVVQGILGSGVGSVRHAVSNDGSRVFWSPTSAYNQAGIDLPALYLRETAIGESFRLDVAHGASGAGEAHPAFQGASADGDVAFFTDSQQLTEDASPEGRDLYRCEIGEVEGGLGCVSLTDLSAPLAGSGESADVFDQVSALSEDGKQLYFVATGVLDDEANDAEESAVSGEPNLYIWQEGQGVRFIASLSQRDYVDWGGQQNQRLGFASQLGAATSPSGRYLAFTSERSLTGYENRNASGELNEEVFVYDAVTSRLVCVSCNPSGAAATGQLVDGDQFSPADPGEIWGGRWVAAILPEASESYPDGRSQYRSRSVLDNGRVFFNAVDPLVSGDSNGHWDVYQYEPIGLGTCTNSSEGAAVARSADGCVGLISSGTAEGDAGFLDASPSGDNVFFVTGGKLSVLDEDDAVDVYDARVNGTPAVLKPISECAGEACQPAAGPPNDPTPASESFRGPENAIHCPKGKRKVQRNGKSRCVNRHRKHKKHHQRAGKDRRAHR
jgi:hypothetical protein